jgi:hypothetical protein
MELATFFFFFFPPPISPAPIHYHLFSYVYLSIIEMTSVTVALYWLVLFYTVTKPYIQKYRPIGKFISIKAILFLTFWQGVLINLLRRWDIIKDSTDFTAENVESGLQDFLICVEMFLASVAHIFVFSHKEYTDPTARKTPFRRRVRHMFRIDDAIADTRNFWKPLPKRDSHDSDEKGSPLLVMGTAGAGRDRAISDLELGAPAAAAEGKPTAPVIPDTY